MYFLQLFITEFTDVSAENQTSLLRVCLPGAKTSWSSSFDSGTSQYNLKIRKSSCIVVARIITNLMGKAQIGNEFTAYQNRKRDVCSSLTSENASHFIQVLFFFLIAPPRPPEFSFGNKLHNHNYLC